MDDLAPIPSRHPHCPTCQAELAHEGGTFPDWVCPAGHGLAATLAVATHRVEDPAVHETWVGAAASRRLGRPCPFCARQMRVVDLAWDEAEPSALAGDGQPVKGQVELEVCRVDEIIWFDSGKLEALPPQTRPIPPESAFVVLNEWANAAEALPEWRYGAHTIMGLVR